LGALVAATILPLGIAFFRGHPERFGRCRTARGAGVGDASAAGRAALHAAEARAR
jgi:hypothetical protein